MKCAHGCNNGKFTHKVYGHNYDCLNPIHWMKPWRYFIFKWFGF